ncbi:LINE-1 reverse transcriptase isogeny [Gossypium australe]|uniref:LINE-1 reverse transcriptase isogeny n=1 Tax=Gossypium australe TaxID=47621 RepID=A0A5B6WLK7_9ROSI|nr:LINE-1 reverse transcriptase isogeny [Gossypium australe]
MRIVSRNIRGLDTDVKVAMIWGDDNFDFRFVAAVGRSRGLITIWDNSFFRLKKDYCVLHWILGGDFNAIRNKSERSNCVGLLRSSKDFGSFIEKCKLVDLPLLRKKFTWYGPDKKKGRLDRFLVDEDWYEHFEDIHQQGLNRSVSDHIPILLTNDPLDWGPKPFKFFNAWISKKECLC